MRPCPKRTPWGNRDCDATLAGVVEGLPIYFASTPSHGGYHVPTPLLRYIPEERQLRALKWSQSRNWYEEDCEWASVCAAFPQIFPPESQAQAKLALASYEARLSAV